MAKIILIKHASVDVVQAKPSNEWTLSDKGRSQMPALAGKVKGFAPTRVFTSHEPKAVETGELLAASLGVSSATAVDLHEHDRSNVPYMRTNIFISAMAIFFSKPNDDRLGKETGTAALARFEAAVRKIAADHSNETVAIVSHGTVIALLAEKLGGGNAFKIWREMGLPSYLVLETPDLKIVDRVDSI